VSHEIAYAGLVAEAALRYRPAGRGPYFFAKGKLGADPVFAAILRQGLIPDNARVIDLGCGQGVLLTLLAVAQDPLQRTKWPAGLPPLPHGIVARGVDLRADAIEAARVALGRGAPVAVSDIREANLGECDVVTILDVLHYIDYAAQRRLLERVYAALPPGGRLLLRAGDADMGFRFQFTVVTDWLITLVRGNAQRRFWTRRGEEWLQLVRNVGFRAEIQPMREGTPFANVLVVGQRP
jgi:2-polyprenyl-3-methyl-5-hydroxy-6-metoxy-1,4-benzoquinol methylase